MSGIQGKACIAASRLERAGIKAMGNEGFKSLAAKIANHIGIHRPQSRKACKKLIIAFAAEAEVTRRDHAVKAVDSFVTSDAFLRSYEWRRLRMVVLKRDGARCRACGATPSDGVRMNVDHIKPRRKYPELALEADNLQVLCEECNHGKGNWDETDWRGECIDDELARSHMREIAAS